MKWDGTQKLETEMLDSQNHYKNWHVFSKIQNSQNFKSITH